MPDANAVPVQPQAPYAAPVTPAQPVQPVQPAAPIAAMPQQKTNGLCIAGLITSLVSIVLLGTTSIIGLILSIIGLITAGNKKEKGKGQAIAGIIISSVLVVVWILVLLFGYSGFAKYKRKADEAARRTTRYEETTRRTTRETTERTTRETTERTTEETTAETSGSESKSGLYLTSVGNDKTGKVALTSGKWITFHEAGGHSSEVVEHEQAQDMSSGSIIGLFVLNVDYDAETVGKAQMAAMEQAGAKKITGARVKIGGYDAVQCYGIYPDDTVLVCWFFKGDDGLIRKITVEFPSSNTKAFSIVEKGYKLDR